MGPNDGRMLDLPLCDNGGEVFDRHSYSLVKLRTVDFVFSSVHLALSHLIAS